MRLSEFGYQCERLLLIVNRHVEIEVDLCNACMTIDK
jgi:hypothetical protein